MAVEKLSVSLPAQLAARIDALAEETGVSRSSLIQEAAAQYVASHDAAHAVQTHRAQVDAALAGFEEVAAAWGDDQRAGVRYLDELRLESSGVDGPSSPGADLPASESATNDTAAHA